MPRESRYLPDRFRSTTLEPLTPLRTKQRMVVRSGTFASAERRSHPLHDRAGPRRRRRLVQRRVDLVRLPTVKRPALSRFPVHAVFQQMDRQPRSPPPQSTRRRGVRHLHPHFREAPRLVERQLAPARVRGVVHFEHHVRTVILADDHGGGPRQLRVRRMQVHRLVRLHDVPRLAALVAQQQVHRAVTLDRRTAHPRDHGRKLRQETRTPFVVRRGRIANPGGLRSRLPILQPSFEAVDLRARQVERLAAGERRRLAVQAMRRTTRAGRQRFRPRHAANVGALARASKQAGSSASRRDGSTGHRDLPLRDQRATCGIV